MTEASETRPFYDPRPPAPPPRDPLPWQFRAGAIVAAIFLALALLELWAGGVRFMKLVAKVAAEVSASEAPPPRITPGPDTPGIVSVTPLPTGKPGK